LTASSGGGYSCDLPDLFVLRQTHKIGLLIETTESICKFHCCWNCIKECRKRAVLQEWVYL